MILPVMCCWWRSWHHCIAVGSIDAARPVCRFGISEQLQKAQIVVKIGKYFIAVLQSPSSLSSGFSDAIVLMKM